MSKIWTFIGGLFTLVLGLFFYEKNKKEDAEAKLENSETKKNDAVLAQHSADVQANIEKDKAKTEVKKQDNSDKALLDFLNKK